MMSSRRCHHFSSLSYSRHRSSRRKHRSRHHYTEQLIVLVLPRDINCDNIESYCTHSLQVVITDAAAADFAAYGDTQPKEVALRTKMLTVVQTPTNFDLLLQKAAALVVSMVVAAKEDYTKLNDPTDHSKDKDGADAARTHLKTALASWSIPGSTLDATDAKKLYPEAAAYKTAGGEPTEFAYQLITQDVNGKATPKLADGLLELFNFHVKIAHSDGTSVNNILNRYTSVALKDRLQKVGELAKKVLESQNKLVIATPGYTFPQKGRSGNGRFSGNGMS